MELHESWAPVFAAFPAASRGDSRRVTRSGSISDSTGRAVLKAFGLQRTRSNERLVTNLVSLLIRCSFYAESAPAGMSREPMVLGVARLFHRVLAGPIDGVNVQRGRSTNRRRIKILLPDPQEPPAVLRPRGERTRQRLLDAGAVVLPARGYPDARVDDIVAAAGVSHGTFYRYFDSKDDFFRMLAEAASDRMIALVDRLQLDAPPDELRAWLEDWFDAYEADGGVISTWQDMRDEPRPEGVLPAGGGVGVRPAGEAARPTRLRPAPGRRRHAARPDRACPVQRVHAGLQHARRGRRVDGDGDPPGVPGDRRVGRLMGAA